MCIIREVEEGALPRVVAIRNALLASSAEHQAQAQDVWHWPQIDEETGAKSEMWGRVGSSFKSLESTPLLL